MKTRLSHTYDSDRQQKFSAQSSYKKAKHVFLLFQQAYKSKNFIQKR